MEIGFDCIRAYPVLFYYVRFCSIGIHGDIGMVKAA